MGEKRDLKQFQFLWAMHKVFNTNTHTDTSTSIRPSPKAHTDPTTATKISIMALLRIFTLVQARFPFYCFIEIHTGITAI